MSYRTPSKLLTHEGLADRLGVDPAVVGRWIRARLIPFIEFRPGVVRFDLQQVVETMRRATAAGTEVSR